MELISLPIALLSLAISGATFWLVYLRRGRLAMTQPAVVFFGFDAVPRTTAKIFIRTLLYSTAANGQVVESMHAVLRHGDRERQFSFWGYSETERLSAGSGIYVSRTGLAANHHFVLSVHEPAYEFSAGDYIVDIYAHLVGRSGPRLLGSIPIHLTEPNAAALGRREGVLFERMPGGDYLGHARTDRPQIA